MTSNENALRGCARRVVVRVARSVYGRSLVVCCVYLPLRCFLRYCGSRTFVAVPYQRALLMRYAGNVNNAPNAAVTFVRDQTTVRIVAVRFSRFYACTLFAVAACLRCSA